MEILVCVGPTFTMIRNTQWSNGVCLCHYVCIKENRQRNIYTLQLLQAFYKVTTQDIVDGVVTEERDM